MTEENQGEKQVIAHLEQELIRANSRCDGMKEAFEEAKHGSELRGWAIDRAIRLAEVNKSMSQFDMNLIKQWADDLVEYANTFKRVELN